MAGRHSWKNLRDKLTPEQSERARERAFEMEVGLLLAELRKQAKLTQTELASRLGMTQPRLSQMECASDLQVSTFRRIVAQLGGKIVVQMPDREFPLM